MILNRISAKEDIFPFKFIIHVRIIIILKPGHQIISRTRRLRYYYHKISHLNIPSYKISKLHYNSLSSYIIESLLYFIILKIYISIHSVIVIYHPCALRILSNEYSIFFFLFTQYIASLIKCNKSIVSLVLP